MLSEGVFFLMLPFILTKFAKLAFTYTYINLVCVFASNGNSRRYGFSPGNSIDQCVGFLTTKDEGNFTVFTELFPSVFF